MYNNWDNYLQESHPRKHHKSPSFSSVLLDEVLRSMDGDNQFLNSSTRKNFNNVEVEIKSFRDNDSMSSFSTTSRSNSSDSSYSSGGSFTSEVEYSSASHKYSKACKAVTSGIVGPPRPRRCNDPHEIVKSNEEFKIKSKSRAMKIYSNLKKVKQPLSPGGRLTSFINSLFTSENSKKMKNMTDGVSNISSLTSESLKKMKKKNDGLSKNGMFTSENTKKMKKKNDGIFGRSPNSTNDAMSCCSPASSSSRSCLSKNSTTNSREKFDNGVIRKVRFGPVNSMILDDDATSYRYKSKDEIKGLRHVENHDEEDDSEDDLFEIDHLGMFENEMFCDELPVYGTTHVNRSRY